MCICHIFKFGSICFRLPSLCFGNAKKKKQTTTTNLGSWFGLFRRTNGEGRSLFMNFTIRMPCSKGRTQDIAALRVNNGEIIMLKIHFHPKKKVVGFLIGLFRWTTHVRKEPSQFTDYVWEKKINNIHLGQ